MAQALVMALAAYFGVGLAFGVWFVSRGIDCFDAAASNAGAGFRLLILPGTAALWPLLINRTRAQR